MHFEKLCQQRPRRLRHMRPRPAFNLRQVRLADALVQFLPHCLHDFLLRHRPPQTTQRAFHFPQVTNFLSQLHITDRHIYIAICNACQGSNVLSIDGVASYLRRIEGGIVEEGWKNGSLPAFKTETLHLRKYAWFALSSIFFHEATGREHSAQL